MRLLACFFILGISFSADASEKECHFSTKFDVTLDAGGVTFVSPSGEAIKFSNDQLTIDGNMVALTPNQRRTVNEFRSATENAVPKIAEVAVEGAELGLKAVSLVFAAMFADDPDFQKEIITPIESMTSKIKANITPHSFKANTLEASMEQMFDHEFDMAMETFMEKHAGNMLGNIFSAIFSGDTEEIEDFAFRMESMERDIEMYVAENADKLEVKAEALCESLKHLDKLDEQLQSIAGYPPSGLIGHHKGGNLSFSL